MAYELLVVYVNDKIFKTFTTSNDEKRIEGLNAAIAEAKKLGLYEIEVRGTITENIKAGIEEKNIEIVQDGKKNRTKVQWKSSKTDGAKTIILSKRECAEVKAFINFGLPTMETDYSLSQARGDEDKELLKRIEYYKALAAKFNV